MLKRYRLISLGAGTVGLCAVLALPAPALSETEDVEDESFYQQITRVIIRLQESVVINRAGATGKQPVGTAFFVYYKGGDYLVSARHVVDRPVDLHAWVPSQRHDTRETDVVELQLPTNAWVFHPGDEVKVKVGQKQEKVAAVDVAVAMVPRIKDRRIRKIGYCPDPCPEGESQQFADADPEPPAMVLVFGFPGDIGFSLLEQRPMGRLGMISMTARQPFLRVDGMLKDSRVVIVDAPIFPGNSGSPIFRRPELGQPFELLGLISATNVSRSYAIAEPVTRIAEALEHARKAGKPSPSPSWHPLPGKK